MINKGIRSGWGGSYNLVVKDKNGFNFIKNRLWENSNYQVFYYITTSNILFGNKLCLQKVSEIK